MRLKRVKLVFGSLIPMRSLHLPFGVRMPLSTCSRPGLPNLNPKIQRRRRHLLQIEVPASHALETAQVSKDSIGVDTVGFGQELGEFR